MSWLEKLSANTFKLVFYRKIALFSGHSPEVMLKRALTLLDAETVEELKSYVAGKVHPSGGFTDRAGQPDLYYTLFGTFVAEALELCEINFHTRQYVENEISNKEPEGIHRYCASILASKLNMEEKLRKNLRLKLRESMSQQPSRQPAYDAFVTLLACYYSGDYRGILRIKHHLQKVAGNEAKPSPVIAALIVLQHMFNRDTDELKQKVQGYYDGKGGFKALMTAPVADLLSTAVVLYASRFVDHDLRLIRPDCLSYIDSLYGEGGFAANALDPDTDIEYTFYGLLALGSLT